MHTYRVWFNYDGSTIVQAPTPLAAIVEAELMYPGEEATKVERID